MSEVSATDEIATEFSAVRRRVSSEVRQAIGMGRRVGPGRNRRQVASATAPQNMQIIDNLVRGAHADLRRSTHPVYARSVDLTLQSQAADTQARLRTANELQQTQARAEQQARERAGAAEQRGNQAEQPQPGLSLAAAALAAAAADILLSEMDILDQRADEIEHALDLGVAPGTEQGADMSVVSISHPREVGQLLDVGAETVISGEEIGTGSALDMGVGDESGLDA